MTVDDVASRTGAELVERARELVRDVVAPRAAEWDAACAIPDPALAAVADAGLWAPFLPPSVGGTSSTARDFARMHEEIGTACSSLRSILTVHGMVAHTLARWGSPAQLALWGPRLTDGRALAAMCLSEPGAGTDTAAMATTAVPAGEGWELTGAKSWITAGARADVFLVFARTPSGSAPFLVPRETPGLVVEPLAPMLGIRGAMVANIHLDRAQVGPDALVGPLGMGSALVIASVLDLGRFSVAAGCVGILRGCVEACAAYTSQRRVAGGVLLRDVQLVRAKVGDMVTDLAAARALVERAGDLRDAGSPESVMATWLAKHFAATAAARHASEAVQVHGAAGCADGSLAGRFYRDAKVMEIIEGSNEIQRLTIADLAYRGAGRTS